MKRDTLAVVNNEFCLLKLSNCTPIAKTMKMLLRILGKSEQPGTRLFYY